MRPALFNPTRRQFGKVTALGACLVAWPLAGRARSEPVRQRQSRALMGTQVDIAAQADDPARTQAAMAAAFDRMGALVALMSHYETTSQVAAINLAAGLQPVSVDPELMQVLAMAQAVSHRTEGAFDATIGSVGRWHFGAGESRMPT